MRTRCLSLQMARIGMQVLIGVLIVCRLCFRYDAIIAKFIARCLQSLATHKFLPRSNHKYDSLFGSPALKAEKVYLVIFSSFEF